MTTNEELVICLVSNSDRTLQAVDRDEGLPALEDWVRKAIASPSWRTVTGLTLDEQSLIKTTLVELVHKEGCHLVLTSRDRCSAGVGRPRREHL